MVLEAQDWTVEPTYGLLPSGLLAIANVGGGLPVEAYKRAFLIVDDASDEGFRGYPITSMADLRGLVVVHDERAALRFVRLFSGSETYFLTDMLQYEIIPQRGIGDEENRLDGRVVAIPGDWWDQHNLPPSPTYERLSSLWFDIRRVVIRPQERFGRGVFGIRELVSTDGEYRVASLQALPIEEDDLPEFLPVFHFE